MPDIFAPRAAWPTASASHAPRQGFRAYVATRKYDYGRGSAAAWRFISQARGDPTFPEIESWPELMAYLQSTGAGGDIVLGARSAWRSFIARRSLERRSL